MTRLPTHWLAVLGIVSLAPVTLSCNTLECGEGTIESDGVCVAADGQIPSNDFCAAGTTAGPSGCVPNLPPTECGANTEAVVNQVTGITECIGTGGGAGCEGTFLCPGAASGKTTVCGQFIDASTSEPIVADGATGALCNLNAPTASGPCSLEIKFYDALQFAQNPTGATPLPAFPTQIDDCGRWRGVDIAVPALGFLGIGMDDSSEGDTSAYELTGVALPVSSGLSAGDIATYVVPKAANQAWTTSAGNPFGSTTFAERGVFMPIFFYHGEPVSGVKVTANNSTQADFDYYFSDTDKNIRLTVDSALVATGVNGAALLVDSDLVEHGGTGGEPTDCVWPKALADAIPGVVFARSSPAEDAMGEECP